MNPPGPKPVIVLGHEKAAKDAPVGAIPPAKPSTIFRDAVLVNLLAAALVIIDEVAFAVTDRTGKPFQLASWLIPLLTLVIWGTVSVVSVVSLASRRRRRLAQRPVEQTSNKSAVWDDWLDSPQETQRK